MWLTDSSLHTPCLDPPAGCGERVSCDEMMQLAGQSGDNWLASTCVQRPVSPTMGHSSYCELHSAPLQLELWSCETAASGSGVVKLLPVTSVVCAAAGRNAGFTVYRRGEEKVMGTGSAILR